MSNTKTLRLAVATVSVCLIGLTGLASPAQARVAESGDVVCVEAPAGAGSDAARGGYGVDTRHVAADEQLRISREARQLSRARGGPATAGVAVPVYVHVMAAADGAGDVTDAQIAQQIAVLNTTFGGAESGTASRTGFTFSLAGTDRFYNDAWHNDRSSAKYRKATRLGGADALNIWLVEFNYLGIATFPWDYAKQSGVDGVRVNWDSVPGGSIANYNLGETATHEVGHWLGLYHTFQGGCTETNDEVSDTPAQGSPTNGCPEGNDTCALPGFDPIHNYMDYSYDTCYTEFTGGQTSRMQQMWTAYRA